MSVIYEFSILKVESNKCQIRFDLVHPDGGDYTPESHNFYLQILVECFEYSLKGYMYHSSNPELYNREYKTHCTELAQKSSAFAQLSTWRDYMFGKQVFISAAEFEEYQKNYRAFEQKYKIKTNGGGSENGLYYYYTPISKRPIIELAAVFIQRVNILKEAKVMGTTRPYWWAEVEIEVSAVEILEHVEAGMFWDSAIYEYYEWDMD